MSFEGFGLRLMLNSKYSPSVIRSVGDDRLETGSHAYTDISGFYEFLSCGIFDLESESTVVRASAGPFLISVLKKLRTKKLTVRSSIGITHLTEDDILSLRDYFIDERKNRDLGLGLPFLKPEYFSFYSRSFDSVTNVTLSSDLDKSHEDMHTIRDVHSHFLKAFPNMENLSIEGSNIGNYNILEVAKAVAAMPKFKCFRFLASHRRQQPYIFRDLVTSILEDPNWRGKSLHIEFGSLSRDAYGRDIGLLLSKGNFKNFTWGLENKPSFAYSWNMPFKAVTSRFTLLDLNISGYSPDGMEFPADILHRLRCKFVETTCRVSIWAFAEYYENSYLVDLKCCSRIIGVCEHIVKATSKIKRKRYNNCKLSTTTFMALRKRANSSSRIFPKEMMVMLGQCLFETYHADEWYKKTLQSLWDFKMFGSNAWKCEKCLKSR